MLFLFGSLITPGVAISQTTQLPQIVKDVAYQFAPFIVHEVKTSSQYNDTPRVRDHIVPVDFDGDNDVRHNLYNGKSGTDYPGLAPRVYFTAHETGYTSDVGYYFIRGGRTN
ncbi:hypothetical protein BH11GEM1_BH11GEM1_35130 [soil metagenome]